MVLSKENRTASGLGTTATAIMAGRSIEAHSISNVSVRQTQAYRGRYSGVDGFPAVPGPVGDWNTFAVLLDLPDQWSFNSHVMQVVY
jgi:hypothetical protein